MPLWLISRRDAARSVSAAPRVGSALRGCDEPRRWKADDQRNILSLCCNARGIRSHVAAQLLLIVGAIEVDAKLNLFSALLLTSVATGEVLARSDEQLPRTEARVDVAATFEAFYELNRHVGVVTKNVTPFLLLLANCNGPYDGQDRCEDDGDGIPPYGQPGGAVS
jgi:hypothetical protein